MTSFVAWTGIDSRGPASLYLASDSRISWGTDAAQGAWSRGRKLFASHNGPHLMGYVGDVVFPALFLGQAVELADAGLLFGVGLVHGQRVQQLCTLAQSAFDAYPAQQRRDFSILYASRDGDGFLSQFFVSRIDWSVSAGFTSVNLPLPNESGTIVVLGSGAAYVKEWEERWQRAIKVRTSRAVFSAFCDALVEGKDPQSGGAPQLVACYREGPAKVIGSFFRGEPFWLGLPGANLIVTKDGEWRNELFERCDSRGQLLRDVQRHHRAVVR